MRYVTLLLIFASACTTASSVAEGRRATSDELAPIAITMSLYVVDEVGVSSGTARSSRRTAEGVEAIAAKVQSIWLSAGVDLEVVTVTRIGVPGDVLDALARGDTTPFLDAAVSGAFPVPDASAINGFYVSSIGGPNGIAPFGARVFFVVDEPSVHDERVSSHEIGHILGLHHTRTDSGRLMFSGTNGMDLAADEIATARYVAQGIVDRVR